uniref:hypothetical protein n=1 Tax=Stappia sp. TaxID=1870903 RepID=UPI003BAAD4C8
MPVPPSDASAARLARIVRLSRIMAGVILVMIAGLPVLLVLVAVFGSGGVDGLLLEALNAPATGSLDASSRAALLLLAAVPLGLTLCGLEILRRLFLAFAQGDILVPASGLRLKRIGIVVACLAPVTILTRAAASVAATWSNPPGMRELAVGFGSSDLLAIIAGMLLVILGWALEEAARVADENRQFV